MQVFFHVQREIVAGLKYIQKLYKMSVPGMYASEIDDSDNEGNNVGDDDDIVTL